MDRSLKTVVFFTARVLIYALLMILLNLVYFHDAQTITSTGKFGENSWTEILQEIFLFVMGITMLVTARVNHSLKPMAILMSLIYFMAFIREFNNQIPWWFYLVIPLLLMFAWFIYRFRKSLVDSFFTLLNHRAIAWLVIGFLVTFVFSRLFGRTVFWEHLLEADYNRWAKNAAEEGIELLGYALMLIGGLELLVEAGERRAESGERRAEGGDILRRS